MVGWAPSSSPRVCSKPWVGKAERFSSIQAWHPLQLSGLGPKTKSLPSAISAFPQISPDSSSVVKVASSPASVVKVKVLLLGWSRNSKTTSAISRDELRRASGSGRTRVQEMLNCVFQGDTINVGQNGVPNLWSFEEQFQELGVLLPAVLSAARQHILHNDFVFSVAVDILDFSNIYHLKSAIPFNRPSQVCEEAERRGFKGAAGRPLLFHFHTSTFILSHFHTFKGAAGRPLRPRLEPLQAARLPTCHEEGVVDYPNSLFLFAI